MSILTDETTGLEKLQRATLKILHDNLNTQLVTTQATWTPLDTQFAIDMGQTFIPITLEPIPNANFYSGHKPSLITRGPDYFPSVTVMAYSAVPGGDTSIDQTWGLGDRIAIETLVKAGFYADDDISGVGETIVNSRIQRTTDSIITVLAHNRTLGGLVAHITETPEIVVSEVFAVTEENSGRWYWQASRIDLLATKSAQVYS